MRRHQSMSRLLLSQLRVTCGWAVHGFIVAVIATGSRGIGLLRTDMSAAGITVAPMVIAADALITAGSKRGPEAGRTLFLGGGLRCGENGTCHSLSDEAVGVLLKKETIGYSFRGSGFNGCYIGFVGSIAFLD